MNMRVVIGIGDRKFTAPLKWAIDELFASGASLFVIHCIVGRLSTEMPYPNDDDVVAGSLVVEQALAYARERGATVLGDVREGFAGEVLVASSIDADMLVLGSSRSRHLIRLPSSVVSYCVRHAACPVTIVPSDVRVASSVNNIGRDL